MQKKQPSMLKVFKDLIICDNLDEIIAAPIAPTVFEDNFFLSVLCERGALQMSMEGKTYKAEAGDMVVCKPHYLSNSYLRSPDLQCKIICMGEHLFDNALSGILHLDPQWWKKFIFLSQNPVLHISEFQGKLYKAYFNLMATYLEENDNPYRQRIIRLTAQSMAVEILHEISGVVINDENEDFNTVASTQKDLLFQRFVTMLNRSNNNDREVRSYAEQLSVTPKYLSAVCKEKSGRTALNWITETTVRNIKYYLMQTDLSVKEIAYKMNFPDVSFFCKYTKKHLGKTPLEFRKASNQ